MLWRVDEPAERGEPPGENAFARLTSGLIRFARSPVTWIGLAYAVTAGAAFEALGAVHGPMLLGLGWSKDAVGTWLALPIVGAMVVGSLLGGRLADRLGHARVAGGALLSVAALVAGAALATLNVLPASRVLLPVFLVCQAIGVGVLTASTYALLMDLCEPDVAATQFSTYMAAGNVCEIWAGWLVGRLAGEHGYGPALLVLTGLSLLGLTFLALLSRRDFLTRSIE